MNAWLYLFVAILLEVCGTTAMKASFGFAKPLPTVLTFVFYILSFAALGLSLKRLDVSVAYAIWAGLGMALIVVIGIAWFREPATLFKFLCIALILAGVVGLQFTPQRAAPDPAVESEWSAEPGPR